MLAAVLAGGVPAAFAVSHTKTSVRADLDADKRAETVRVVHLSSSWLRLQVRDRRSGKALNRWMSPKARRMSDLVVRDITGDRRADVWYVARLTRKAPARTVAALQTWDGRRATALFRYDSHTSKARKRFAGARLDLVQVSGNDGTAAAASEIRVVERQRVSGKRRETRDTTTYYRLQGARFVKFTPEPGATVSGAGGSVKTALGPPPAAAAPATAAPAAPTGPAAPITGRAAGLVAPAEPPAKAPGAFIAPNGNDGAACTAAAPCQSIDRAYHVVQPGQVVQAAGGTYGKQILTADSGKPATAAVVAVRPAPGAAVTFGEIDCGRNAADLAANQIELADMTISDAVIQRCAGFTLRRVTVDGAVFVDGSTRFSMIGGSVGPGLNYHPDVQTVNGFVPQDVLFEGVAFHDWTHDDPAVHVECLQVSDVVGFTLRNSTFKNCDTFDIHVGGTVAGPVQNVVIENNTFEESEDHTGQSPAYYAMSVRDGIDVLIRNNASSQAPALPSPSNSVTRWTVANNVMPLASNQCDSRITFSHNLWSSTKCGSTDQSGALGFVNAAAGDFRPAAGSKALDAGDPTNATQYDLRGKVRDARPDIGAFEGQ